MHASSRESDRSRSTRVLHAYHSLVVLFFDSLDIYNILFSSRRPRFHLKFELRKTVEKNNKSASLAYISTYLSKDMKIISHLSIFPLDIFETEESRVQTSPKLQTAFLVSSERGNVLCSDVNLAAGWIGVVCRGSFINKSAQLYFIIHIFSIKHYI